MVDSRALQGWARLAPMIAINLRTAGERTGPKNQKSLGFPRLS